MNKGSLILNMKQHTKQEIENRNKLDFSLYVNYKKKALYFFFQLMLNIS
jgi:hypothetical protein